MNKLPIFSLSGFIVGILPLLGFAFLSPGIDSEEPWGYTIFLFAVVVCVGLALSAKRYKWMWGLVIAQIILLGLVLLETFSDSVLYIGT